MQPYYRSLLTPVQQRAYDALLAAMMRCQPTADLPPEVFNDPGIICDALRNDHPLLFHIDQNRIQFIWRGDHVECTIGYLAYPSVVAQKMRKIEQIVASVVEPLKGKRDLEKALALHDYLVRTVTYGIPSDREIKAYTVEGVFLDRTAVCQGIALAYMLLCERAGLRATVVFGLMRKNNENHTWNMVWIDGRAYHADVTNDHIYDDLISRAYFLMSDKRMRFRLEPVPKFPLPPCPSSMLQMPYAENQKEFLVTMRRLAPQGKTFQIALGTQYQDAQAIIDRLAEIIAPEDHGWYGSIREFRYDKSSGILLVCMN